jgi:hypothetical protein
MDDKLFPLISIMFFFAFILYYTISPYLANRINTNLHLYIILSAALLLISMSTAMKTVADFFSNKMSTIKTLNDYVFLAGGLSIYILLLVLCGFMIYYWVNDYSNALHNVVEHDYLNYLNNWIFRFLGLSYIVLCLKFWNNTIKAGLLKTKLVNPNITNVNWNGLTRITAIWTMFMVILFNFELKKFSDDNYQGIEEL